ncbi:MAG: aromatic amino acid lyase, partial [Candidatus Syntrophosphaera sp.]|nr:aromatic amino acid lyase [Candidatus Syntrophosphaera sp.]
MSTIYIDGNSLNLEEIEEVAFKHTPIALTETSIQKVKKCREYVEKIIEKGDRVYGLNTGFGKLSSVAIPKDNINELQINLIRSHSTSVGPAYTVEQTRAIMLLRINVLAKGYSGIRWETLQTLVDMLNKGVHPLIPMRGSVGASG